ncbi:MAG: mechanosensitive ion channel [Proteobacteria bacterium]|nr:mechanosensitive ion channel [Pseudomonadota bacterium]
MLEKVATQTWESLPALALGFGTALAITFGRALAIRWLKGRVESRNVQKGPLLWLLYTLQGIRAWYVWALGLNIVVQYLPNAEFIDTPARVIFVLLSFIQVGLIANAGLESGSRYYLSRHPSDGARATTTATLVLIGKMLVWLLVFLLILSNFGVDITALVAGLGLGGVALALALKGMAEDMLGSLSIVFDKPFVLGDFIIFGEYMGTVENIGMKTSRIRSLGGELIVVANRDLLASRIRNYGRMYERRVLFSIGVEYSTTAEQLEAIPHIIRGIVEDEKSTRFDRSHFSSYGDSALNFETVYYVLSADYNKYMDIQQAINLAIFKTFQARGIAFAFPTRTLHIQQAQPAPGGKKTEPKSAG